MPPTPDPRFAKVSWDPRFAPPKKSSQSKVHIDERFKSLLSNNGDSTANHPSVDRYGRKVKPADSGPSRELKRLYDIDVEEEEEEEEEYDPARGKGLVSSSEEEDEEESLLSDIDENALVEEDQQVEQGEATHRLALVNLDWDNVRSSDIMVSLSSFVPPKARILSVKILPSEYGKQHMELEEMEGPSKEIFSGPANDDDDSSSSDDDSEDEDKKSLIKPDKGEEVDSSKLRQYQLQRLKYYYAVIECDSINTAQSIYNSCDGAEFESSANVFDLRYIPDDMTFEDEKPRDECDSIPINYTPIEFLTDALNHSKVKLTWDQTPIDRLEIAKKSFSRQEIEDMDLKAYLASSSDDDDDGEKKKLYAKYRSLLPGVAQESSSKDMQVTFTSGLERPEDMTTTTQEFESTIDKYRRKEKEKRQARFENANANSNSNEKEVANVQEDDGFEDEFFQDPDKINKKLRKNKSKEKAAEKIKQRQEKEKSRAELELLMADDQVNNKELNHFDMKDIIKGEKLKAKKNKKKSSRKNAELLKAIEKDDFDIDVKDARLGALYNDYEFAIDPSHSQFKKTSAMNKLLQERQRRRITGHVHDNEATTTKKRKRSRHNDQDISTLIDSVKGKAKRKN